MSESQKIDFIMMYVTSAGTGSRTACLHRLLLAHQRDLRAMIRGLTTERIAPR